MVNSSSVSTSVSTPASSGSSSTPVAKKTVSAKKTETSSSAAPASSTATTASTTPVPVASTAPVAASTATSTATTSAPVAKKAVAAKKAESPAASSTTVAQAPAPAASTTPAAPAQAKKSTKRASAQSAAPVVEASSSAAPAAAVSELSVEDDFTSVLKVLGEMQNQLKNLSSQVRGLQKHVSREHRDLQRSSHRGGKRSRAAAAVDGADKPKRAPSGFAKPTGLSPELCAFLGVDQKTELARTDVTKKITTYVREQHLQNEQNKKIIVPDAKLGKLLNVPAGEQLTYFNLQRYMKVHFRKMDALAAVGSAPVSVKA